MLCNIGRCNPDGECEGKPSGDAWKFWRQKSPMMPETTAPAPGNRPDLRICTGNDMPGKIENTRDATYTANLEVLENLTVRIHSEQIVSEEEKLNVETQENIGFLRRPSEMQVNRKLFQGRCAKEMPSKARKQEKV